MAYGRLQEEIIKTSNDQSLFAWGIPIRSESRPDFQGYQRLLASSPKDFAHAASITMSLRNTGHGVVEQVMGKPFVMTNRGLQITLPVRWSQGHGKYFEVLLNCDHGGQYVVICLASCTPLGSTTHLGRISTSWSTLEDDSIDQFTPENVFIDAMSTR